MNNAMCALMNHDDKWEEHGPRPTLDMNQELFLPVVTGTKMTHFYGCAERSMRDCFLHRAAWVMVEKLLANLSHVDIDYFSW